MAENIKCSLCSSDATVHLTQIVNNKIHKVDLCESCAQKKGVTSAEGFSLADLLSKAHLPSGKPDKEVSCPRCGFTTADFRRTGRLGCPSCYEPFRGLLLPVLEDMHVGLVHAGKVPRRSLDRVARRAELDKLQASLATAIEEEAYEQAAKFRDKIRQLEGVGEELKKR